MRGDKFGDNGVIQVNDDRRTGVANRNRNEENVIPLR